MFPISNESGRRKRVLAACAGIVLGIICFYAGRLSVLPTISRIDSKTAVISTAQWATKAGTAIDIAPATVKTQTRPSMEPLSGWDESRWRELTAQPGTVARNAALAALLEKLAASDPAQAMDLARSVDNLKLREGLVQAVLRGWGSTAPKDAANWALTLPKECDRSAGVATVLASAVAANPDEAVRVANLLCQQNPGGSVGYGTSLVDALCDAGNFATAAQFAASGENTDRNAWLGEAYSKWAALQPEQAAAAASAIADSDIKNQALHGVVGGWADADPAGLTQFLAQLPPGGDRATLLGQALQSWARQDPEAASAWMNNSDLGPDLDDGVAAIATMDILNQDVPIKPEVAAGWATSITNPQLRSEAVANVLRDWVHVDLPAAQNYFTNTKDLLPPDREQIAEIIADMSGQSAETPAAP